MAFKMKGFSGFKQKKDKKVTKNKKLALHDKRATKPYELVHFDKKVTKKK